MRTVDVYAQARALVADPRTTWHGVPPSRTHQLQQLLAGLLDEIEWLRLRAAVNGDEETTEQVRRKWAQEAEHADTLALRLDRIENLHSRIPGVTSGGACGVCASGWPCQTVRAAKGMEL